MLLQFLCLGFALYYLLLYHVHKNAQVQKDECIIKYTYSKLYVIACSSFMAIARQRFNFFQLIFSVVMCVNATGKVNYFSLFSLGQVWACSRRPT